MFIVCSDCTVICFPVKRLLIFIYLLEMSATKDTVVG